jgi:hypothetical protein
LLFQGRLDEANALAPHVEQAAQRHGLLALQLVVRGSLAYVDALSGRHDELTRHAASIDELAAHCPHSYLVAGSMVLTAYALATAQRAKQAADVLLRGAGGPQLPNIQLVDRAYGYELLVAAALSLGDVAGARQWGDRAVALTGLPHEGMTVRSQRERSSPNRLRRSRWETPGISTRPAPGCWRVRPCSATPRTTGRPDSPCPAPAIRPHC